MYHALIARYSEPHRHYHTMQHLDECFARLDEVRDLGERVHEVDLALWFHDAVYATRNQDNEAQSAEWARIAVEHAGLPASVGESVYSLILATKHDAEPATDDAALLIDVDLAILGASAERFDEYERQVREEYSWVPGFMFRGKRREILTAFLDRPHVYNTERFRLRFESVARANLARSIAKLDG